MENENFAASKANDPLMSQNNQGQAKVPTVAVVVEEDEVKKKFLPPAENDGVHYKKDFGQVEIKQTPKFIGLTQEELQQYADDPFWRRLRLALFILFWISWILMFVIAIVLVVTSPKCPDKPIRHWWQKQICYQAYTRSFKDSDGDGVGDFKGMKEKLYDISRSHIQTIWPVPVLASASFSGYDVIDFKAVDSRLGTMQDFEDLIKATHDLNMRVIIDLPVTTMSTQSAWFQSSNKRSTGDYSDFFIWKIDPPAGDKENYFNDPTRNEYYRVHKVGDSTPMAVLNWKSAQLGEEMKKVLEFWINKGIDGFYIGNPQLLGVNPDGGLPKWDMIDQRIGQLRDYVNEITNGTGKDVALFTTVKDEFTDDAQHHHIKNSLIGEDGLQYILNTELTTVDEACDAKCIRNHVYNLHDFFVQNNDSWPVWEIGSPYVSRVASRFRNNREKAELLQMLLFMLEGSINTYYGDELGLVDADPATVNLTNPKKFVMRTPMQWNGDKNAGFSDSDHLLIPPNPDYATNNFKDVLTKPASSAKLFRKMAEWRMNDEAFLFGNMEVSPEHESVVAVKRNAYRSSANYYAIMNFANVTQTSFNLTSLGFILPAGLADPTVGIMTSNLAGIGKYRNRDTVDIKAMHLEPYSGIVIKYK